MVKTEDGEYSDITFIEIFGYAIYSAVVLGFFFLIGVLQGNHFLGSQNNLPLFRTETLVSGMVFAAFAFPGLLLKIIWRANVSESVS